MLEVESRGGTGLPELRLEEGRAAVKLCSRLCAGGWIGVLDDLFSL